MATRQPQSYFTTGLDLSSTQVTNINQQFIIGTESLNVIPTTIGPADYDSTVFQPEYSSDYC